MAKTVEFVHLNDFMARCPTRSELESLGQEDQVVKISKKPQNSYQDGQRIYETYSIITVPIYSKNPQLRPKRSIGLLMKIKRACGGKVIKYKVMNLKGIDFQKLLNTEQLAEDMNTEQLAIPIR
tara:strand:+ start:754 stop:1125 length:372 start_codon:yes stop_codon:yes gene_type:complete